MARKKTTSIERQNSIQKKMELAQRRILKAKLPESLEFLDGDTKIILPYPIFRMGFESGLFNKVQQEVIMEMFWHIREKLIAKLHPESANTPIEGLFKPEDFLDDDEIGRVLVIEMQLRDFGVRPNHYPELKGALKGLSSFVVTLPYIDGKKRKWTEHKPLFYSVITAPEDKKYDTHCVIKIEKKMAEIAIDMKLGYGKIGRNASHSLSSKYAGRIHMLLSQNADLGGFTLSINEFRTMLGIQKKYMTDWGKVEKITLLGPKEEIDEKFSEGLCDYSYTYELLYNNREEIGFPDAVKFTIYSATSTTEKKLVVIENSLVEQFKRELNEILDVSSSLCNVLSKRITVENSRAALSKIVELHAWLQTHEIKTNKAMFVAKSMNNFFDSFEQRKEENKDMPPMKKWQKITETVGKGSSAAVSQVISRLLFVSFDEETNTLYLQAPSPEFAKKEVAPHESILIGKVHEYFGKEVNIKFTYKED